MNEALRDAWLAEMWRPVREVPKDERDIPTPHPHVVDSQSRSCAQNGAAETTPGAA